MKLLITCITLVCFFLQAFSQTNYQKEINDQVWKPFIKTFNNKDGKGFSALHSKELIRVERDNNRLLSHEEYAKSAPDSASAQWKDWKNNIELRFTQRIASADKAFETGYYKSSSTNIKTGQTHTGYGRFHVLLRKENGVWKILMDADAKEDASETTFKAAKPLE